MEKLSNKKQNRFKNCELGAGQMNPVTYISIPDFYKDRSIFLTGATGFIGKIFIEKLLRSCPQIKCIYVLIRPKKGHNIHDRLSDILKFALFDKIRAENPKAFDKIIPINGDMKSKELGISHEDLEILIQNVSIVFHSAATVRFDEQLKEAINVNVIGTRKLLDLSRKFMFLQAFVHISTAYSNCDNTDIDEVFYDLPFDIDGLVNFVEKFPEKFINKCTKHILGNHPNTYTFTKAMTEIMLKNESDIPIAIVRPAIVSACMKEPLAGWVDNYYGPTAIIAIHAKGICHTFLCSPKIPIDLVPADFVINSIIAAGWKTALSKSSSKLILNITSSNKNPIIWNDLSSYAEKTILQYPFEGLFWYPTRYIGSNKLIYYIYVLLAHFIPAYLFDFIMKICGQKSFLVKIHKKFFKMMEIVEFFKLHQINFNGNNVDQLLNSMSKDDRKEFQFDVREIEWKDYIEKLTLGIRKFIFKQDPKTIYECRKKLFRFKILHYGIKMALIFGFFRLIIGFF